MGKDHKSWKIEVTGNVLYSGKLQEIEMYFIQVLKCFGIVKLMASLIWIFLLFVSSDGVKIGSTLLIKGRFLKPRESYFSPLVSDSLYCVCEFVNGIKSEFRFLFL